MKSDILPRGKSSSRILFAEAGGFNIVIYLVFSLELLASVPYLETQVPALCPHLADVDYFFIHVLQEHLSRKCFYQKVESRI